MMRQMTRLLIAIPTRGDRPLNLLDAALRECRAEQAEPLVRYFLDSMAPTREVGKLGVPQTALVRTNSSGYAHMRNEILTYAIVKSFDYVLFFDDDQVPLGGWLPAMIRQLSEGESPHVVFGPVLGIATDTGSVSVEDLRTSRILKRSSGSYKGDVYSGNTLVNVRFVQAKALRFDAKYNRTGGEDTAFFRRLRASGGKVSFAAEAIAIEMIPRRRLTIRARFHAGRVSSQRKDAIGRPGWRRAISRGLAVTKALSNILLAISPADQRYWARASFWIGVAIGRGR